MKTTTLAALILALLACPALGQTARPLEGLDAYVQDAMEAWDAVGLAVAVVEDGRVVFQRGYGVRTLGQADPVDEHTLFSIGSTTKAMTAAAIGMLVDEGKLEWDDPVIEHLPWFQLHDPWATRELTVRDLLTHRAGLPNADYLWYEQEVDTREILERLRLVEADYSMRSGFIYQNVMYGAAGEVIAAVSGEPWASFIRRRIFEPLGMDRSVLTLAGVAGRPNVASPHAEVDGEVRVIENAAVDPVPAAGSIWSSAHDMARWLAFLLRDCETESGERLLEESTCQTLFTPQTMVGPEAFYPTARLTDPHWTTYGLGWFQHDYEGRKVDFHTGSIDGMIAIAGLLRDEGVGVYVLGNLDHVEVRHALMYRVFDLYDAEPARDWSAEMLTLFDGMAARRDSAVARAEASRVEGTTPSLPLDRYVGTYTDPLYGTVVVSRTDEGMRFRWGRLVGSLRHWHYDTFRAHLDAEWRGAPMVTFRLSARGDVATVEVGGAEFRRRD